MATNRDYRPTKSGAATVERTCEHCGASFLLFRSQVKQGLGRYCSRECKGAAKRAEAKPSCSECLKEGRERPVKAQGLCGAHYARLLRHGDTTKLDMRGEPAEVRFWAKVDKNGPLPDYAPHLGPCWLWTAAVKGDGYAGFHRGEGRHVVGAHIFAYELVNGPVPPGLVLDHLCRVRRCVNPAHLEPVTQGINTLRGETISAANAAKTHCPQGHPYDEENTRWYQGRRYCKACKRR